MTTLGTVAGKIASDLDRGELYAARIRQAIQNQIKLLRGRRYTFNVKRIPLLLGSEYVELPDYVMETDAINVNFGTYRDDIKERNEAFIRARSKSEDDTGPPDYFAVVRDGTTKSLRLWPIPDMTLSATMVCLVDLVREASLSASMSWSDGVELAWFDDGELIIKYAALAEMEGDVIGGDKGKAQAQYWANKLVVAEAELAGIAGNEQHSGHVKPVM